LQSEKCNQRARKKYLGPAAGHGGFFHASILGWCLYAEGLRPSALICWLAEPNQGISAQIKTHQPPIRSPATIAANPQ
jgi:hypothetical protein